jgi:hypothetical protein
LIAVPKETEKIPLGNFNLVTIEEIESIDKGTNVDVLGLISNVSQVQM